MTRSFWPLKATRSVSETLHFPLHYRWTSESSSSEGPCTAEITLHDQEGRLSGQEAEERTKNHPLSSNQSNVDRARECLVYCSASALQA